MPTTGHPNSTIWVLSLGATPAAVGSQRGSSLSISHNLRDITTKDSEGWQEHLEGLRSGSVEISGIVKLTAGAGNFASFTGGAAGRSTLAATWGTGESGDPKFSGTVYVESAKVDAPDQENNCEFSATLKFTGPITIGTFS